VFPIVFTQNIKINVLNLFIHMQRHKLKQTFNPKTGKNIGNEACEDLIKLKTKIGMNNMKQLSKCNNVFKLSNANQLCRK